jgi:ABC-type glycerol-3-phosphate transport system substrate-binding protein
VSDPSRIRAAAAAVAVLALLAASGCGGSTSSSDKAKDQACSAVSDIKTQVNDLQSLTISTDSIDQAQKDLQAIQDDLKTIQQQAPNVKGDLQTQLKDANQAFEQSVSTTLQSLQSGSLGSVTTGLTQALTTLESSYQQAFSGVKC